MWERTKSRSAWYKWQEVLHNEAMARKALEPPGESYEAWQARMRRVRKNYGG